MSERRGKWARGGVACSGRRHAGGDLGASRACLSPAKKTAGGKSEPRCLQCSLLAEGMS